MSHADYLKRYAMPRVDANTPEGKRVVEVCGGKLGTVGAKRELMHDPQFGAYAWVEVLWDDGTRSEAVHVSNIRVVGF